MAKTNIAEFAIKEEATPGESEALSISEVLVPLRTGYTVTPEVEEIDLEELRSVSSHSPSIPGRASITFAITYVLRGPGNLTTIPAAATLLKAAMLSGGAAKTIAIGAITAGPFQAGETISGGTSLGTGLVLQRTATGAGTLPYLPLTGVLQSGEVLTGASSGATVTTTGGPGNGGYALRPADSTFAAAGHVSTCQLLRDGLQWTGRGCLADLSVEFNNGGPAIVTENFQGAWDSHSDQALYGKSPFPESTVTVPKFLSVDLSVDNISPVGITSVNLTWPTGILPAEDAQLPDGVLHSDYNRKATAPTITVAVDQAAVATFDYFQSLRDGTTHAFEFTHGADGPAGTRWTFSAPKVQFQSITPGSRDPERATFDLTLKLTGSSNEELLIWQH